MWRRGSCRWHKPVYTVYTVYTGVPKKGIVMKKIAFCLAVLTLLASLAGCGRRQEILNQIESEKVAESIAESQEQESNIIGITPRPQETVAPRPSETEEPSHPVELGNPAESGEPSTPAETLPPAPPIDPDALPNNEGYRLTGGIQLGNTGYYEGVTADILKDRFLSAGAQSSANSVINTPTGILFKFDGKGGSAAYNKITRNISTLCPDPLCRHTDCAWGQFFEFVYVSEEHLYFTVGNVMSPRLFRSDLERNHVEDLGLTLPVGSSIVCIRGDRIYLQMIVYKENTAGDLGYGYYDCSEKKFTLLSGNQTVVVKALIGDTVYYNLDWQDAPIYKANLDFSNAEIATEFEGFDGVLTYNQNYIILYKENVIDSLYNVRTGEFTDVRGRVDYYRFVPVLADQYLYYLRKVSESEIAHSPLKEYYQYKIQDPRDPSRYSSARGKDGGRLYRMNLETGEEELVVELSYNGVPVHISEFMVDGNAVYIGYYTYEDHNNYYNQNYKAGTNQVFSTEKKRYAYMDISNGTINLIDPYPADAEAGIMPLA